ncbi:hypothetical protein FRC03_010733 [Tulasnella sp. 419]|nr:hypothetical protein FRC02_009172 [Tulasnella sp. 418]KAG8956888.1 hypothetical protein FRC03_010733 [Tulasnella sp. 419]
MPIGPALPKHLQDVQDDDSSDDDYGPALPPDLARPGPSKPVVGPSFPTGPPPEDDESDEDVGPMPLPEGLQDDDEEDGVAEFLAKEKQRQNNIEAGILSEGLWLESKKPKALQRDEWMLKPPEASDLLGTLDPAKLRSRRQFSRNTEEKSKDQTLWTETPAERQKRLAEEVEGKRKRTELAAGDSVGSAEVSPEAQRKRKRDQDLQRAIQEHNKKNRSESLLEMHSKAEAKKAKNEDEAPPAIWDRDRDMGLGGRLMDEKSRSKLIKDARGLGDRFGHSKGGSYM